MAVAVQWAENVPLKINGSSKLWQRLPLHAALRVRERMRERRRSREPRLKVGGEDGPGNAG